MIQDCQQFDLRIQSLLDQRIDPETDGLLGAHCAGCPDCQRSLIAYSLLHTEFLRDTDSMKLKLENLGLQDLVVGHAPERQRGRWIAVAASLAAMLLLAIALSINEPKDRGAGQAIAMHFNPAAEVHHDGVNQARLETLAQISNRLNQYDLYNFSTELPPIRSFKALSMCFDWLQRSWQERAKTTEAKPDLSRSHTQPAHQFMAWSANGNRAQLA